MFWDSATLSAELAANGRLSVTRNATALDGTSDKAAASFRSTFEPTYFGILSNLDLTPILGLGYNVGNSSTDAQNRGVGDIEFGVTAVYRVVWAANITISHFLGGATRQPLADRDFISFSIQRTF
jgi:hypothetical protein